MGRSNNQRRRTSKATGRVFLPAWTKSKTKNRANEARIKGAGAQATGKKKLAYNKMINKSGKVVGRKFRAGGYNTSGKLGNARTTKKATGAGKKGSKASRRNNNGGGSS